MSCVCKTACGGLKKGISRVCLSRNVGKAATEVREMLWKSARETVHINDVFRRFGGKRALLWLSRVAKVYKVGRS